MLDSRTFPVESRFEMFRTKLTDFLVHPTRLEKCDQVEGVKWNMDLGTGLLQGGTMTGDLTLASRPPSRFDDSSPDRLSLGVVVQGVGPTLCLDRLEKDNEAIRLIDLTSEFVVNFQGFASMLSFEIDYSRVGLSVDAVRRVVRDGGRGPLHRTFRRHLIGVAGAADELSPEATASVGLATANLARAVILSTSHHEGQRKEAFAESAVIRILDYIYQNLGEADLTPVRIAAAHNISLRYLYQLLSHLDRTPSEWIYSRRLAAAKEDLAYRQDSVFLTAQRWGFKDHSHFTRRFKAEYGITPTEYREGVRAPA